jgi:hypothetical protein
MYCGKWYWTDLGGNENGPYETQIDALWALMRRISPPWYVELWTEIKRYLCDTRG